jgi:alcohol dehydrogenase class IV
MMDDVEALAAVVRAHPQAAVVGVGGGSVLDLSKVATIVAAEGSPAERHAVTFVPPETIVIPELRAKKRPVVAVPTTFSGSEGNGSGQIRGGAVKFARSFRDDAVTPSLVVLDPAAGLGQTPLQAVSSALNATAHCATALYVRHRSAFSDALASEGLRLLLGALRGLAGDPAHPVARVDAQWGSYLAGVVIRHAFAGAHHALSHALVTRAGFSHAMANALVLPHSIAWHLDWLEGRDLARLQAALPAGWDATLREATAAAGLPASLTAAGLRGEQLDEVVEEAMGERMVANELRPISRDDIRALLMRAAGSA